MKTTLKALAVGTIAALGFAFAGSASAATPWQIEQHHRAQVQRHMQQERHISYLERTGRISHWQARQMRHDMYHRGYGRY